MWLGNYLISLLFLPLTSILLFFPSCALSYLLSWSAPVSWFPHHSFTLPTSSSVTVIKPIPLKVPRPKWLGSGFCLLDLSQTCQTSSPLFRNSLFPCPCDTVSPLLTTGTFQGFTGSMYWWLCSLWDGGRQNYILLF